MSDPKKLQPNCKIVSMNELRITPDRQLQLPDVDDLPVLPARNLVIFPGVTIPLTLVRESSRRAAAMAKEAGMLIGLSCQKDADLSAVTGADDLCEYGTLVEVLDIIELPDDSRAAVLRARQKYRVLGNSLKPHDDGILRVAVEPITEPAYRMTEQNAMLIGEIKSVAKEYDRRGGDIEPTFSLTLDSLGDQGVINYVSTAFPLTVEQKIRLLSVYRVPDRGKQLLGMLSSKMEQLALSNEFKERARQEMERGSREAFLREEMEAIRRDLYGDDDPAEKYRKQAAQLPLPEAVGKVMERELAQLSRTNPTSPDFAILSGYIETVLNLPWGKSTPDNTDFDKATLVLESDHYGLAKVKERILEQIALLMHNPKGHAPILCLVGPPGVGKTSLGQSVARAMGRRYQRVSLGGLHDEAEIRGHRRTYLGAMPGRIIDAVRRAESVNPVLLLDEIDKIGADYKGDPSAALLEVLDPEQNCHFHDNYVDVDFDLSDVLFIATANTLSTLSQPLLDRMEIIELSGYAIEEKLEIARRHLMPRVLEAHRLAPDDMRLADAVMRRLIEDYTSESGVRQLEKMLGKIARQIIMREQKGEAPAAEITAADLEKMLGKARYRRDRYEGNDLPGVVTGLAWTAVGGEILFIEAALIPGKDGKLSLTGNLGDVMKESATLAMQYVRSHAAELGIDATVFDNHTVHIHVPEGAVPKDGPSAGVTMTTAIVSALTGRKVRDHIAMTGEITLRGRVTAIGGVKEKVLAAKRAGITTVILPRDNEKDILEIEPAFLEGLEFHYFDRLADLLAFALV